MNELVLYNIPPSLCSQKVRLALVEKGVAFKNRWVDIGPTSKTTNLGTSNLTPSAWCPRWWTEKK